MSKSDAERLIDKCAKALKFPENLSVSEWADKYRMLSAENSAEAGHWKTSRTPYLYEIMNSFTDPKVHRIVVVASSQLGKSEMLANMIGYAIDIDPGPMMFVHPTEDVAKDFSKRRLAAMFRDTKTLRDKVSKTKSRDSSNTILQKKYPGGMMTLAGSNAPGKLAGIPARYVFGDEIDRWAKEAGTEGDPWSLLEARTTTFYNHKMVQVSTPTIKGASAIASAFDKGTQEYWETKCPECGEFSYIDFASIVFEHDYEIIDHKKQFTVKSVHWCCKKCGCLVSEKDAKKAEHKWVARNPGAYYNGARSFWINGFASPWQRWDKIILAFLQADGDPTLLKPVFNTKFGELWEDRGELLSEDEYYNRRERYGCELPEGVLCITIGVDTQDNRFEYEVVGHGRFGQTWGIDRGVINGKPNDESTWESLDGIIDREWMFEDGIKLKASITFIDSGGHYTQEVYAHCAERVNKRVFAIKGMGGEGKPYTAPPTKVNIVKDNHNVGKAWLYVLGVDAGKERIMSALKVEGKDKPRYMHFPQEEEKGFNELFFSGLLSEKLTYKNNKWTWEKIPGHERNEPLDCRNYAMAALAVLRPNLDMIAQRLKESRENKEIDVDISKPKAKKKTVKKQKKRNLDSGDW